jgi:hypothetical protein
MALSAFELRYDYSRRSLKLDQMDFDAAMKESNAIMAEVEASPNPLVKAAFGNLPGSVTTHREAQARLRLLRAVTGFLATGEMRSIPDPFGKELSYSQQNGKLRIQSKRSDIFLEISR